MNDALHELFGVEQRVGQTGCVKLGILQAVLIRHVLLKNSDAEDRQRGVEQIVHRDEHWIEDGLDRKVKLTIG